MERDIKSILNKAIKNKDIITLKDNDKIMASENEKRLLEWNNYKREYIYHYYKKGRLYLRYTKWTTIPDLINTNIHKIEEECIINFIPNTTFEKRYDKINRFLQLSCDGNLLTKEDLKELDTLFSELYNIKLGGNI